MVNWELTVKGVQYDQRGERVERIEKTYFYNADTLFDVAKQIWRDHFKYGDNIDDYGTYKLGDPFEAYDGKECRWSVSREDENGEYRAIYRVKMVE